MIIDCIEALKTSDCFLTAQQRVFQNFKESTLSITDYAAAMVAQVRAQTESQILPALMNNERGRTIDQFKNEKLIEKGQIDVVDACYLFTIHSLLRAVEMGINDGLIPEARRRSHVCDDNCRSNGCRRR